MKKFVVLALLLGAALLAAPAAVVRSEEEDSKTRVEVIDAGAEPRVPLRYKFTAGQKESLVMDMSMNVQISVMGMDQPEVYLPTMRMVMGMVSESVNEEGDLKYTFELTDADVLEGGDPMMVAAMRPALRSTVGMKGWGVVSPRGITRDGDIELPPGADPQMAQSMGNVKQNMNQMSAPLPEEPVGVGAVWKVHMAVDANQVTVKQTATYRLVSLVGDVAELEVSLEQNADKQVMDLPDLPPGITAELQSLKSTGAGTATVDFSKLIPTSSIDMKMKMKTLITAGEQEQATGTKIDMKVKIFPRAVTGSNEPVDPNTDDSSGD